MMTREDAVRYRRILVRQAQELTDEDALTVPMLFERWKTDTDYTAGERIYHEGVLYRCVQGHTSQDSWTPDLTPALWTPVSVDEWPEWRQPSGAQDAYNTGDKVSHNEKRWVSTTDGNVWEPGIYGWDEVI